MMRWRTTAYAAWAIIGILVLLATAGYAIGRITSAIAPFLLAFLLVFFTYGFVGSLERRGLRRVAAVALTFAGMFLVVSVVVVFLVPLVSKQAVEFASQIPRYVRDAEDLVLELQARFSAVVVPDWLSATVQQVISALSSMAVSAGQNIARGIVSAGSGVATVVFDLFLGVVIAFWTLADLPKIRAELQVLAGEKYEADLENLLRTVVHVVGGYLKGQTVVSLVTGTLAGIGLALIGVPYALTLAILTFFLNFVPYIGPLVSGAVAGLVGLFIGPWTALFAVLIVIAAQQVTDLFVTPRVMSDQVDLHPTLVIFSLLVGAALFGFWGMILAIPVAATGKGLFVYYWERRTNRQLSSEDGALFRSVPCDDVGGQPGAAGEECAASDSETDHPTDEGART
jgi:predicted PurR-regulated permease PerM